MAQQRRRREYVSQHGFDPETAAQQAAAPPKSAPPAPDASQDFEDAVAFAADDLPIRQADMPAPLTVNRGALNDELPLPGQHVRPQPQTQPKRQSFDPAANLGPQAQQPARPSASAAAPASAPAAPAARPAPRSDFDSLLDELEADEPQAAPARKAAPAPEPAPAPRQPQAASGKSEFDMLLDELAADDDFPVEDAVVADAPVVESVWGLDDEPVIDRQPPRQTPPPTAPATDTLIDLDDPEPAPEFGSDLIDNEDFWSSLESRGDADDDGVPSFSGFGAGQPDAAQEPASEGRQRPSMSIFRRRPEPKSLSEEEIERLKAERPAMDPRQVTSTPDPDMEDFAPLAVDDEQADPGKNWHPPIHVATRQAMFAGPNALSLVTPSLGKDETDELSHAMSAFAQLEPGQKGFIHFSLRTWPGFKEESRQWLAAQKTGQDIGPQKVHHKGFAWIKYLINLFWFEVNKANPSRLGGLTPPLAPGQRGDVKPLRASDVSDETKQAWRDAERKVLASPHYECALRVGVVGKNDAAQDVERIVDEVALGFETYNNNYQQLVWRQVDPYDTTIAYMGTKRDAVSLALSADELGELARVPDDLTRPQGVQVKRSSFKQLPLPNPLYIEDPYNPQPGMIPLGIMNPRSEDAKVFGMRVAELDKHMYYVGATGTGKSELMKWLVFGVAKADYPAVIIDPHGALSEDVLNMLVVNCPERLNDIVMCDLSDPDWPIALNPLDVRSFEGVEPTVQSIMEMLDKQMQLGSGAPRAINLAAQALAALCEANLAIKDPETKCTLLHVVTFFVDVEFRRLVMEFCSNISIKETFDPEKGPFEMLSEKQQTEFAMPIIRAFQPLGNSDSFSAVFSAGENRLDFGKLIGDNKIVIVKLARFSHQKKLGEFVGALILPWLLSSMDSWGRQRDPETGEYHGRGCRVFVDEAPTLIGPRSSAIEVLAESRKWDLGLVTTSQYPSQFDKSVVDALFGNTNSKISLRLDPSEAGALAKSIAGTSGKVTAGDVADLPNFHYYANVLLPTDAGASGSGPFSAACLPPINCDLTPDHKRLRELVKERSRELIANDKQDIAQKRPTALDHIKGALQQMLIERADDQAEGSRYTGGGADYAMNLDALDDNRTFGGW